MLARTIIICVIILHGLNLFGHEVNHVVKNGQALIVSVGHGPGNPMSYAAVKIYSPDDNKLEYQNSYTDKNGNCAFLPDRPGSWRFVADDGMGHHVEKVLQVKDGMIAGNSNDNAGLQWSQKIIMVLIFIWGTIGTVLFFKRKNV